MKRQKRVISSRLERGSSSIKNRAKVKPEVYKTSRDQALSQREVRSNLSARKRIAREKQQFARMRRIYLLTGLAIMALILAIVGIRSLIHSDLFTITEVSISGNTRIDDSEVLRLSGLSDGETLLRVPVADIGNRIEKSPWVSFVEVSRSFPDTLRIKVTERAPYALLDTETSFYLVDTHGYVLARQSPDQTVTAVVIRDLDDIKPVPGKRPIHPGLENALDVYRGLNSEMRQITRAISAPTIDETAIITFDGVEIYVGSAELIDQKSRIAMAILEERGDTVVYINVRSVERPTWRALESP